MENYIGLGFLVLCSGISVSLVIGITSIAKYYVYLNENELEVSPSNETSTSNTHE